MPDLADPMMIAIMTSRRKKRANVENLENGVVILYQINCFEQASPLTGASNCVDSLLKAVIMIFFLLRGKWNSEYSRKIMRKVFLSLPCVEDYLSKVMTICTDRKSVV